MLSIRLTNRQMAKLITRDHSGHIRKRQGRGRPSGYLCLLLPLDTTLFPANQNGHITSGNDDDEDTVSAILFCSASPARSRNRKLSIDRS